MTLYTLKNSLNHVLEIIYLCVCVQKSPNKPAWRPFMVKKHTCTLFNTDPAGFLHCSWRTSQGWTRDDKPANQSSIFVCHALQLQRVKKDMLTILHCEDRLSHFAVILNVVWIGEFNVCASVTLTGYLCQSSRVWLIVIWSVQVSYFPLLWEIIKLCNSALI